MAERISDPNAHPEDEFEYDQRLRPIRFQDMAGQDKVKEKLQIAVDAARLREEAMDHTLLYGPPGLGKTTLGSRAPGDKVNLEVDILAKYVERLLRPPG